MPPSTKISLAAMKLLSSEARKATTFATSSSVPVRARGVMSAAYSMKLFSASRLALAFSCAGVGITPGLIALTRMPRPRKSDDHVLASFCRKTQNSAETPGFLRLFACEFLLDAYVCSVAHGRHEG